MAPELAALVALQRLDTAADHIRRRLGELPAARQAADAKIHATAALVEGTKIRLQTSQQQRRGLEKDVAAVDSRLSRFEDHRASVKTNQEYTALLHEIATAKAEKDAIEERILVLMEEADAIALEGKHNDAALSAATLETQATHRMLNEEQAALDADLARLVAERVDAARDVTSALLRKYDQLLKQRRGVAVAEMTGELCTACHVRLRPSVAQQVRRNTEIVQCDSCQRILYHAAKVEA